MKKLVFLISLVLFISSCGNAPDKSATSGNEATVVSVNDFYSNPDLYLGTEVTIGGTVTHVCKHGGQKLFITASEDGETLRIDVGESIPEFKIEMEGSEAEFTGVIELMDGVLTAQAEHKEHHGEEEEGNGGCAHESKNKNYHLVAKSFRSL